MTHFLQTTFALCVYCLQSIWKTSNEKEDIFLFSEHIFQQKRQVRGKAFQMGKPGCNFTFSSCSVSTFSIFFFSILLHYRLSPAFLSLFFSYFVKNISKGREKQMHSYLTPAVSVIYEFWICIEIESNQQMVGNMNIHEFLIPVLLCRVLFKCKEYTCCPITTVEKES